ncbi:MATE family efflux transporter [Oscillospiraceae bacterium OttesenSCG-928-G22]|nr:MATE family efflux transporter [Oscillospiraceae bacterium OttesenSCG-928-G22]
MNALIRRFFTPDGIVGEHLRRGEIPGTKDAYKMTLTLAGPAIIEMVFLSLVGMVDTMMVGGLGDFAIAAVGLTNQPRLIFMAFFFALNVGVTAIVARRKGQGEQKDANLCLMQSLLVTGILSVVLSVLAFVLARPIMTIAGAEADTIEHAIAYFQVIGGTLFIPALTLSITGSLRGVGNMKTTLIANVVGNLVNICCNYLLIDGNLGFPRLEVRGAAIATAIGNFVGLIIAFLAICRKNGYLSIRHFGKPRFDVPMLRLIAGISGSAIIEQMCLRIGFFAFVSIIARLGTFYVAAHQICLQMLNLTFTIGDGLSVACTSLVGQSLGKKRPDLAYMFAKLGQRIGLMFAVVMFGLILIFRTQFVGMFTKDPALIAVAANLLILMAFAQPSQISHVTTGGALRGAGDTRYVAMTMLLTVGIIRPGLSAILIYPVGMGLTGAWVTILIDQTIRYIMLNRRLNKGTWMSIEV